MANPTTEEQMVRGRGARDRSGNAGGNGGGGGGDARAAGGSQRGDGDEQPRSGAARSDGGERRAASRNRDDNNNNNNNDGGRRNAVPKDDDRDNGGYRDSRQIVVNRQRPTVNVYNTPYRGPRYYAPVHFDRWARSYYRWSPVPYVPWSWIYGSIGWSSYGFYGGVGSPYPAYPVYPAYGYGPSSPWQASGYDLGGVRLKIRPRDAQVFVDGYYAGVVDDFDGTFQSLKLESGGHKIEIRMPGYQDIELDVHVQPGRTITLSEDLRPRP